MNYESFTRLLEIKNSLNKEIRLTDGIATNQHTVNELILEALELITTELIELEAKYQP